MKALKSIVALALCAVLLTACSNEAAKNTPGTSPDKANPSPSVTEPLETPEVTVSPIPLRTGWWSRRSKTMWPTFWQEK